jgi:short-subunit dehydrogenase
LILRGKRIVITGGSSGIGKAVAEQLLKRENSVTIVGNDERNVDAALTELRRIATPVTGLVADIGDRAAVIGLAADVLRDGVPDVLLNNAGFGVYRTFEASDADEIDRLLAVNLGGHVQLTKLLLAPMIVRRSGAIGFMASIAGRLPITPNATYCAAKHGIMGLAAALRHELRRFDISVTAICPGRVETPFFAHPTFVERTRGPETRTSVPVARVAAETIRALERGQAVSYIPRSLGLAAWLYETAPFVMNPLFDRILEKRIERLYADSEHLDAAP